MSCALPIIVVLVIAIGAAMAWQKYFAPLGSDMPASLDDSLRRLGKRSAPLHLVEVLIRSTFYALGLLKKGVVPLILALGGTAVAAVGKACGGFDIPASLDALSRVIDSLARLFHAVADLVRSGAQWPSAIEVCSDAA